MRIVRGLAHLAPRPGGAVVAAGNFDGVHLGHRALVAAGVAAARAAGLPAVVLTFHPHPRQVLNGGALTGLITPFPEKAALLAGLGVDELAVLRFDRALAALEPADFARRVLADGLATRRLFVGFNFAFGRYGAGRARHLEAFGRDLGFAVEVVPPVRRDGFTVSSSSVRLLLATGSMDAVAAFLGRPYVLAGRVVAGDGIGRTLGFPTANLRPAGAGKILPKPGVYAGLADFGGPPCRAVINVGTRPTIGAGLATTVEAHLLDYDGPLYGRRLEISFNKWLRDEVKFSNLDDLRDAIAGDCARARHYFRRLLRGGD